MKKNFILKDKIDSELQYAQKLNFVENKITSGADLGISTLIGQ